MDSSPETSDGAEPSGRRLILGLGNPGDQYQETRHNLGFQVVEELARRREMVCSETVCNSLWTRAEDVDLALPQTYMNRSGYSARCLAETHGYLPEDVLVVYDEVAIPLGKVRFRRKGSPGGHRGIESVIEGLRTDEIPRLRVGIAPANGVESVSDLVEFVLERFSQAEGELVADVVQRAADACDCWLAEGAAVTMNRFN